MLEVQFQEDHKNIRKSNPMLDARNNNKCVSNKAK